MIRHIFRNVTDRLKSPSDKPAKADQPEQKKDAGTQPEVFTPGDGKPVKKETPKESPKEKREERPRSQQRRRRSRGPKKPHSGRPESDAPKNEQDQAPKPPQEPWDRSSFEVEVQEGKTRFHDLSIPDEVLHAIDDLGFKYCTPIQAQTLPDTLKGKDASGKAQTGTGKTAAFLITMFSHFLKNESKGPKKPGTPRALIIAPTRELVLQIEKEAKEIGKYAPHKVMAVFGGMAYEQQQKRLQTQTVDVVVATPGRLIDFKKKRDIDLSHVEILVIDEADRMLDMGFIPDVRDIVRSTPHKDKRQTLLFSATLTREITRLAEQWTTDPVYVEIEPEQITGKDIEQVVYITTTVQKFALLYNMLKNQDPPSPVMVFSNRRDETERLSELLTDYGISCALFSGAIPQTKRLKTLEGFREGKIRVLVCTDAAGRGIHVDGVSHVINYNLPQDPENYVHRIGRTGRAGASGISVSFACEEDSFAIPDIEAYIGHELKCTYPDEAMLELPPPPKGSSQRRPQRSRSGSSSNQNRNRRPRSSGQRSSGSGQRSSGQRQHRRGRNG